jgi:DNA-binding MarR family transcriptional regulator
VQTHAVYRSVRTHAIDYTAGMASTEDDRGLAAWRALLLAQNAVLRAIESDLNRAGAIPLTWYDVLLELSAAPQRKLRMQELADRVVLSRTRVSRLVDDLEARGLVVREPDPTDGRATLAAITPAGRAARRKAAPVYLAGIERHFTRHLDESEQHAIAEALQRVAGAHAKGAHANGTHAKGGRARPAGGDPG